MRFSVEPTDILPSKDGGQAMRYVIRNDAEVLVAWTESRTWADHICALLNASGEDHEPTPEQWFDEVTRDSRIRQEREAEL